MKEYPKFFKSFTIISLLLTFLSGCLLIPTMLDLRLEWDMAWRLSLAARVGTAAIHLIVGILSLMILGACWPIHIRKGWRMKKNHISGVSLVAALFLLGLTSVGIYYFGDETYSLLSSISHTILGIILFVFTIYHVTLGKRKATARRRQLSI